MQPAQPRVWVGGVFAGRLETLWGIGPSLERGLSRGRCEWPASATSTTSTVGTTNMRSTFTCCGRSLRVGGCLLTNLCNLLKQDHQSSQHKQHKPSFNARGVLRGSFLAGRGKGGDRPPASATNTTSTGIQFLVIAVGLELFEWSRLPASAACATGQAFTVRFQ